MKKKDRQLIFDKYNGKCAYCGCDLEKGWHVDEIEPIRRGWEYKTDENGKRIWNEQKNDWEKINTMMHPERLHTDNQNPACASCNINKHSDSLEDFRTRIKQFVESLNKYSVQYKIAKRYGLVIETGIEVKFYFETIDKK